MRKADVPLSDDIRPVGWYKFPCKVHVLAADPGGWPPPGADQKWVDEYEKFYRSGTFDPFPKEDFEPWKEWADEVQIQHLNGIHHVKIKDCDVFFDLVLNEVSRILKDAGVG